MKHVVISWLKALAVAPPVGTTPQGVPRDAQMLPLGGSRVTSGDPRSEVLALYVHPLIFDNLNNPFVFQAVVDNADDQAPAGSILATVSRLQLFDAVGGNYDRARAVDDGTENQATTIGALVAAARGQLWNGVTWQRMRAASAAVQAQVNGQFGVAAVALVGNWSSHADPAVAAQATVTRAAGGAGVRHIATSIAATLNAGAGATGILKVYLRDGAAGVGPILWSASIQAPAATFQKIVLGGLSITGSPATAMTLEFSAAAGAGSQENVSLTGYSVT